MIFATNFHFLKGNPPPLNAQNLLSVTKKFCLISLAPTRLGQHYPKLVSYSKEQFYSE